METSRFDLKAGDFPGVEEDIALMIGKNNGYLMFENLDLTGIQAIETVPGVVSMYMQGGNLEVRIDSPEGELIGNLKVETTLAPNQEVKRISLKPTAGKHDIYFVFKAADSGDAKDVMAVVYFRFLRGEVE